MAKDPLLPLEKADVLFHVKKMAQSWERGHAILTHMANQLLKDCMYDHTVVPENKQYAIPTEFDELEEDLQLTLVRNSVIEASAEFEHHYQVVFSALQNGRTKKQTDKLLPAPGDMVLWFFGPVQVCANSGDNPVAQMISQFSTRIKQRQHAKPFWESQFIQPMKNNAKEWRKRFRALELRFAISPIGIAYAEWKEAKRNEPGLKVVTFVAQYNKRQLDSQDHVTAKRLRSKISRENAKLREA